jgi:hypothetical protein
VQPADRAESGELRSINIHRQGSDMSSEQTPLSRYTPSALLLPAGGHSSQHNSPMHAVAEGAHATAVVSTPCIHPTADPHPRSSVIFTSAERLMPAHGWRNQLRSSPRVVLALCMARLLVLTRDWLRH